MVAHKKILYWGPYSGHVGTIKAQINSAHAMSLYGKYDVILIRAHSEFKGYEGELKNKGIRLIDFGLSRFFPGLEKSSRFARRPYMLVTAIFGFLQLIRVLRSEKPDMIVLNLVVVPALLSYKISRIKSLVLVSVQGYPHFLGINGEKTPLWKQFENAIRKKLWNLIYPIADYVLTMTERTRDKLVEDTVLNDNQVKVMHNPVIDETVFSGKERPAVHGWFHQSVPLVVGVGRLSHQKGFDLLIKAFSIVINAGLEARLLIVGEGGERDKLEEFIKRDGLENSVTLVGYQKDPYPYIAHADLFVLSSRWEDPGHAIIEAAALNTPIVTTDCPSGPSDLVGQGAGGWICKSGDINDMAEKIMQALMHPDESKTRISANNSKKYRLKSHFISMNALIQNQH